MAPGDTLPEEEWPTRSADTAAIWQDDYVTREQKVVYETVPPLPPERNGIGLGLVLGLGVVAAAAIGVLAAWWLTRADDNRTADTTTVVTRTAPSTVKSPLLAATTVVVPALAGLEEHAALVAVTKAGLAPRVERRTTGPTNGHVFSQHPSGLAKVSPGTRVTILLNPSSSASTLPVDPAASPSDVPTAKAAKPAAAATTTAAAPNPTGTATAQMTKPANAESTATDAPNPTVSAVPDLSGTNEQQAVQALNAAGLVPSIVFVPATDPLGSVMGQAKAAGTTIIKESTVTITISKGSGQNPDETVPAVVGQTLTDALARVNGQQLRMIYLRKTVATREQAGKIVLQTPPSGARAPRNGQVLVYLGAFSTGR